MGKHKLDRLSKMLRQVGANPEDLTSSESLESLTGLIRGETLDVARAESAAKTELKHATESLDLLLQERVDNLDERRQESLEAIVMPQYRPVIDIIDSQIQTEQLTQTWRRLATDKIIRSNIESTFSSIGRIDIPNHPTQRYAGTGFLVGKDVNGSGTLMTNRHVAEIFSTGIGIYNLQFSSGQTVEIDFLKEHTRQDVDLLTVKRVLMIHPYWDMALLEVVGLAEDRKPLKLSVANPESLQEAEVCTVGYPGYHKTEDVYLRRLQSSIFRDIYYKKRFQPGRLKVREEITSYKRKVPAITHDCSTLGGNSGSAVLIIPQFPDDPVEVVGLHFAGAYLHANYAVPTYDLASDSHVVNAGINFSGDLPPSSNQYEVYWSNINSERLSNSSTSVSTSNSTQSPSSTMNKSVEANNKTATWKIPLEISVTFGTPELSALALSTDGASKASEIKDSDSNPSNSTPNQVKNTVTAPEEGLFSNKTQLSLADLAEMFSLSALARNSFDWHTALSLAVASKLVYENKSVVESTAQNSWGLDSCKFIDVDETQCFIASANDTVLISFRGTKEWRDWLINLDTKATKKEYGKVHRGFYRAFTVVKQLLEEEIEQLSPSKVLLTGHSLGGALATIAAVEWHKTWKDSIKGIYTFGQPAVGKKTFSQFFNRHYGDKFFRFVNDDDIVTQVPPEYHKRIGKLYHFDASGSLKVRMESMLDGADDAESKMMSDTEFDTFRIQLITQRIRQASVTATESIESPVEEGLLPSVSDHDLSEYIRKIQAKAVKEISND